jgi:hypothetical protein
MRRVLPWQFWPRCIWIVLYWLEFAVSWDAWRYNSALPALRQNESFRKMVSEKIYGLMWRFFPERLERWVALADCWNWGKWGLKEYRSRIHERAISRRFGHNLGSFQTWGVCMNFLNHREGSMLFYRVFLLSPFQCTVTNWRFCKRLRGFLRNRNLKANA